MMAPITKSPIQSQGLIFVIKGDCQKFLRVGNCESWKVDCAQIRPTLSPMSHYSWSDQFLKLYGLAKERFAAGRRYDDHFFTESELRFLHEHGHRGRELYDFAEDAVASDGVDDTSVVLIAAARRDYFIYVQCGQFESQTIGPGNLPPKDASVDGIVWLPRLIRKAYAKLEGRMTDDLMYGCGGDRRFFKLHDIHPADFLRMAWAAKNNDAEIIDWVKRVSPAVQGRSG